MAARCSQLPQCLTHVLLQRPPTNYMPQVMKRTSMSRYRNGHLIRQSQYHRESLRPLTTSPNLGKYVSILAKPWSSEQKRAFCNVPDHLSKHQCVKHGTATRRQYSNCILYVGSLDEGPAIIEVDLALEERLKQQKTLAENIAQRGMDIDLNTFIKKYEKYKILEMEKCQLEAERDEISDVMKVVVKDKSPKGKKDKGLLIKKGRAVKEKLKDILRPFHELEKEVMLEALNLPNAIHTSTPKESCVIRHIGQKKDMDSEALTSHMVIGKEMGILRFFNISPGAYYMMGDLADLELDLTFHITNIMRNAGYEQFACPDTVKSIVMEGCGADYLSPHQVFSIEQRSEKVTGGVHRLHTQHHLCGASPPVFAAYLTKMNLSEQCLPMKCFTMGRSYSPNNLGSTAEYGLLAAPQTTKLELFGASKSLEQSELVFEEFLNLVEKLLAEFDLSFRCVQVGAEHLGPQEMCRLDYQVWMSSFRDYFTLGNVSLWGDYFSRRLMAKFSTHPNEIIYDNFIFTTHSTGLNLQILLAALIEEYQNKNNCLHLEKILKSKR